MREGTTSSVGHGWKMFITRIKEINKEAPEIQLIPNKDHAVVNMGFSEKGVYINIQYTQHYN